MNNKKTILLAGGLIGLISVALVYFGNPGNMGFCIACFLRDIAGALGLHKAANVSYVRPEIIGLVLGAMGIAIVKKEFGAKGGSSPFTRFILGFFVMIGALVFLGCPLRMMLRIAGGDLNALVGLAGFATGILCGIFALKKGFTLRRAYRLNKAEGFLFPGSMVLLLILLVGLPTLLIFSTEGPGAAHAPIILSLIAGLIVGALGQRTRLCMVGGIRDVVLFKDYYLLTGFLAIIATATIGNLLVGSYNFGFAGQPIAHTDGLWNFLGMVVVGWGSVLLGGCPFRQLILSAEGNIDSVVTVMGLFAGAAFSHNFALASSPQGPTANGQIAVIFALILFAGISYFNREK